MRATNLVLGLLLLVVTTGCAPGERYLLPTPIEKFGLMAERLSAVAVSNGWKENGQPRNRIEPYVLLRRDGPPEASITIVVRDGKPVLRLWINAPEASRETAYQAYRAEFAALWTAAVGDLGYPPPSERLPD